MRQLRERIARPNTFYESTSTNTAIAFPQPEPRDSERYLQYQRGLINLHRTTGIPPTVKRLNGEITKLGDLAVAGGTYSDIWLGMWLCEKKVRLILILTNYDLSTHSGCIESSPQYKSVRSESSKS